MKRLNFLLSVVVVIILNFLHTSIQFKDDDGQSNFIDEENIFRNVFQGKISDQLRKGRFLTFNKEANKIRVEAAFAIPFLTIPVGGKMFSSAGGLTIPQIDVSLKAIMVVGGIFLLFVLIIPNLFRSFMPGPSNFRKESNGYMENMDILMRRVSDAFEKYDVDVTSCAQKAMCYTMNKATRKIKQGNASGVEKLLDAISSMPYLKYLVEDTWLSNVLDKLLFNIKENKGTCKLYSEKCTITGNGFGLAAGSLLKSIKHNNSIWTDV